jgi:hypothetical protein|tara:strand:- start:378 stop:1022 length:645 start_codon:yes stop_codon:yes gene_type:complete
MTIKLNGSTAGSVALDAPASTTGNADITFKLPVADGTAGQVLKTDGSGNLSWADPNISEADQWYLNTNITSSGSDAFVTGAVFTRVNGTFSGAALIGTGISYNSSNGEFTFPSTGKYLITLTGLGRPTGSDNMYMAIRQTVDNSTYLYAAKMQMHSAGPQTASCRFLFDVTNVSTHKIKLFPWSMDSGSYWESSTGNSSDGIRTNILFQKLGET